MDVEEAVREAISARTPLAIRYGDGGDVRTIHPHVLFRMSNGKVFLDGYQVDGPTSSGGLPAWRLFTLEKIEDAEALEGSFDPAPGLDLASSKYAHGLLAHIAP